MLRGRDFLTRLVFYGILLCYSISTLRGQDLSFQQINYTVEDGLPSNECHRILQDKQGYIWIATDRGLVRYDGYEFRTYGVQEGLNDISCLDMQIDKESNIWIRTYSNKIIVFDRSTSSFQPYPHQHIIDSLLWVSKIYDFYIDRHSELTLSMPGLGFLSINKKGEYVLDRYDEVKDSIHVFTKTVEGKLLLSNNSKGPTTRYSEILDEALYLLHHNHKTIEVFDENVHSRLFSFKVSDSIDLVSHYGVDYFFIRDSIVFDKTYNRYSDMLKTQKNSLLSAQLGKQGVKYFSNVNDLIQGNGVHFLENVSASSLLEDKNGDIWISTLENGIYRFQRDKISSIQGNSASYQINSIELAFGDIYYVYNFNMVSKIDERMNEEQMINKQRRKIFSLNYNPSSDELIVNKTNALKLSREGVLDSIKYTYQYPNKRYSVYGASFKEAFCFDTEVLVSTMENFMVYENIDSTQVISFSPHERNVIVLGAIKLAKNSYLLGTLDGPKLFENGQFTRIKNCPEVLKIRINEIIEMGGWLVFGTQGNGVVFWDRKNKIVQRTKATGLVSDNIEHVVKDKNDIIHLCTKAGLSSLWFDKNDSLHIRSLTSFHGLPSNEVNDVARRNDTLFIATGKGIAILDRNIEYAKAHRVYIEELSVNDSLIRHKGILELKHNENNVIIRYKTIDHTMDGKIDYRYRLNGGAWTIAESTVSSLTALPPDNYLYEVQSKNIDNVWSDSTIVQFRIHSPWWQRSIFQVLAILLILMLGFLIYKFRTKQLKSQIKVAAELKNLERSALQAQMNPHFIFNCLNSIQRYIMDNDKEQAMEYLSMFAKLIRQSLNASVENKITLAEEISMLRNYLKLEKLRFKNSFDFKIKTSNQVTPEEISLPPLLVQPYVENAVLHGMKTKKSNGLIEILFEKNESKILTITVIDNGTQRSSTTAAKHKSLGMSITNKRLAYNNSVANKNFKVTPNYTEHGTTVRINVIL